MSRILATKKFATIRESGIKAEDFSDMFPYVSVFLVRLIEWRLDNEKVEIPFEIMNQKAAEVMKETLEKNQSNSVKVAIKNDN